MFKVSGKVIIEPYERDPESCADPENSVGEGGGVLTTSFSHFRISQRYGPALKSKGPLGSNCFSERVFHRGTDHPQEARIRTSFSKETYSKL